MQQNFFLNNKNLPVDKRTKKNGHSMLDQGVFLNYYIEHFFY